MAINLITRWWPVLALVLFMVAVIMIDTATLERVALDLGPMGPLFMGLFLTLTQVVAPIPGAPAILLSFKLYGFDLTTVLFMGSSAISAMINFALARHYGRPLVERLVRPESMITVDRLVRADTLTLLLFARMFGYAFFDLISYAIGLTKIRFSHYMLATVFFSLPPLVIQYLLFRDMDLQNPEGLVFFIVSVVGTGAGLAWFFMRLLKARTRQENSSI
ncbi:MAG: TVP38/TMEM64 family protein [Magnetococcales bacterium]|nr:TVP38/TMEM64 family protein [Magnetococcales bacterium]